jgi:hypothetical protein
VATSSATKYLEQNVKASLPTYALAMDPSGLAWFPLNASMCIAFFRRDTYIHIVLDLSGLLAQANGQPSDHNIKECRRKIFLKHAHWSRI